MILKIKYFLLISLFLIGYSSNSKLYASSILWNLPAQTLENNGQASKVATDYSGKYVYVTYATSNNLNIQKSSNFGITLSAAIPLGTSNNDSPEIVTNGTGQYVYVIWIDNSTILVSVSSDFGESFSTPFQLEASANGSSAPQISTDASGKNVFTIWRDSSANIRTRISNDFGVSWCSANTIDTGGISPYIVNDYDGLNVYAIWATSSIITRATSTFGTDIQLELVGQEPKIVTSDSGQYVHAIWENTSNNISVGTSSNFGFSWNSAVTLSSNAALYTSIASDSSGKYVHTAWYDATNNIRVGTSSDFGQSFTAIDISETGSRTKIVTDDSGRYVYLIWLDSTNNVRTRLSTNFGITFESSVKLTSSAVSEFTQPDIVISRNGKYAYATWAAITAPVPVGFVNGIRLVFPKNVSVIHQ